MLANYSGSLVAALIDLFPEVVFDESQFTFVRSMSNSILANIIY